MTENGKRPFEQDHRSNDAPAIDGQQPWSSPTKLQRSSGLGACFTATYTSRCGACGLDCVKGVHAITKLASAGNRYVHVNCALGAAAATPEPPQQRRQARAATCLGVGSAAAGDRAAEALPRPRRLSAALEAVAPTNNRVQTAAAQQVPGEDFRVWDEQEQDEIQLDGGSRSESGSSAASLQRRADDQSLPAGMWRRFMDALAEQLSGEPHVAAGGSSRAVERTPPRPAPVRNAVDAAFLSGGYLAVDMDLVMRKWSLFVQLPFPLR